MTIEKSLAKIAKELELIRRQGEKRERKGDIPPCNVNRADRESLDQPYLGYGTQGPAVNQLVGLRAPKGE